MREQEAIPVRKEQEKGNRMSMRHNNEKGQAMIEFAIIIPLFFFMLYAFAYLGMFFHDYLTLNEMTRDITRKAAVGISVDDIKKNYQGTTFLTNVYTIDLNNSQQFSVETKVEENGGGQKVVVTLKAVVNAPQGFWKTVLPQEIPASLTMRKEE